MKIVAGLYWFAVILAVTVISFVATYFGDWLGHVVLSVSLGSWFGLTLAQPSVMESRMPYHIRAVTRVLPVFIVHIGMQFVVNELTRRGIGYALSGSTLTEMPWATVSASVFAVFFLWGRANIKAVY